MVLSMNITGRRKALLDCRSRKKRMLQGAVVTRRFRAATFTGEQSWVLLRSTEPYGSAGLTWEEQVGCWDTHVLTKNPTKTMVELKSVGQTALRMGSFILVWLLELGRSWEI